jgi:cell cycle sensor histidine kinase DivJ
MCFVSERPAEKKRSHVASTLSRGDEVVWWHGAWLAAVVLCAVVLTLIFGVNGPVLAALGLGALPALLVVAWPRARIAKRISLLAWGACAAGAIVLTGGAAGPLSAWHLAPLASAAAMGRVQRLALGAAVSLAVLGVSAVAGATLDMFVPDPGVSLGLGLVGAGTVTVGLAVALIMLQRRVLEEERGRNVAEARLQRILAGHPHVIAAIYPSGKVMTAWGHTPRGVECELSANQQIANIAAPDDRPRIKEALRQAMTEGAAEIGFTPVRAPDGWLILTLRKNSGSGMVGALRDASAERSRERELIAARDQADAANAGKSRFLANMSHELRTPLNAIMGFSDIMRQRLFGPLSDRYGEYAELVHESGGHLLDLINDVLDMSKIEAERFELAHEDFDAREAVSGVLRLMRGQADRAGVQLRGVLPKEPIEVDADRRAMKQIALNLISNALKFTPRGGAVTVTAQADGGSLELIVADTGVGMSPEDLARVGRPYEQAGDSEQRAAGTGLGLSLVRAFAELHGGEMQIESRLGEGTTVTVRMPVVRPA